MQSNVTVKEDYILVEPHDHDYWELLNCFGKLFDIQEYLTKSVVWKFNLGPVKLSYSDLDRIRDFVKTYYPKEADPKKKVAIVVESALGAAMAEEYVKIMNGALPFKFMVFRKISKAEKWIRE
jgi:hypothetical protein